MNRTLKDNENSKLNIQYQNNKLIITSNKSQSIKSLLFNQSFFSNSVVKRIISENRIYDKNNKTLSFKQIIEKGQKIYIDLFDRENSDYVPIEYPLEILYEDDFVIIINKPVDNILFFTKHNDKPCIASYLSHYYKKNKITAKFRFVNRLDKDTTGIIIVAKTKFSHTWLLENHEKIYIAVSPK
ncbi:MAG: pseudouridine synthase, partial [Candidatus Muiribacteriota bacterium]